MNQNKKKVKKRKPFYSRTKISVPKALTPYRNLKEAVMGVFNLLGGVEGMYAWAMTDNRNKSLFYKMASKMLPSGVSVEINQEDMQELVNIRKALEGAKVGTQLPMLGETNIVDMEETQNVSSEKGRSTVH